MRRGIVIGWALGTLTLGAGLMIGANWYETRQYGSTISPDEWRALVRDACEPVSGPSSILYYRCPRLRLH